MLDDFQALRACLIEIKIGDDQFRRMERQSGAGGLAVGKWENFVPLVAEQLPHHLHHRQLVIDQ